MEQDVHYIDDKTAAMNLHLVPDDGGPGGRVMAVRLFMERQRRSGKKGERGTMKKADKKMRNGIWNLSWKILDETTVIKGSWIDMRASTPPGRRAVWSLPPLRQSSAGFWW